MSTAGSSESFAFDKGNVSSIDGVSSGIEYSTGCSFWAIEDAVFSGTSIDCSSSGSEIASSTLSTAGIASAIESTVVISSLAVLTSSSFSSWIESFISSAAVSSWTSSFGSMISVVSWPCTSSFDSTGSVISWACSTTSFSICDTSFSGCSTVSITTGSSFFSSSIGTITSADNFSCSSLV